MIQTWFIHDLMNVFFHFTKELTIFSKWGFGFICCTKCKQDLNMIDYISRKNKISFRLVFKTIKSNVHEWRKRHRNCTILKFLLMISIDMQNKSSPFWILSSFISWFSTRNRNQNVAKTGQSWCRWISNKKFLPASLGSRAGLTIKFFLLKN